MAKISLGKTAPLILVLIFAFFAGRSLLHPGLPPTHDGEYHVVRFYEFYRALEIGDWYPRWAPDLNKGYGLPLFNYVYPLPNYMAALFHFFGASFIDAFKLNLFLATILGAVFMYLWARQFWGNWGGIVASVFYTYSPYHFLDIYIRGSIGEVWALAFFPGFLWTVTKFLREDNLFFAPISALFLALIIFSHNILALMFFPFAITYSLFLIYLNKKSKFSIFLAIFGASSAYFLFSIVLGLGLSAIFWLPAIWERGYVRGLEVFDWREHFVEIYQLLFPSWGSGFSADLATQGLSFQIGIANLIVLFLATLMVFFKKKEKRRGVVLFLLVWVFLVTFLMLKNSEFIWTTVPLISYFQFPWRFLSLVILFSSFLAGSLVYFLKRKLLIGGLILLTFFLGVEYSKVAYYHLRDDSYYLTRSNFIEGTNSPGDTFNTIWFNQSLPKTTVEKEIRQEEERQIVKTNTAFFPGWQGFVDGRRVETEVEENGLIQFWAPLESSKIEVRFLDTPVRKVAKGISGLSLLLLLSFLFIKAHRVRMRV